MYDFDGHIKKRAGEYGLEPREQVWDRIEQELNAKKTKRRAVWLWWLLPILLLGGGMATYQFLQSDHAQEETAVSMKQTINTTLPKEMQANPSTADLSPITPVATESLPQQAPLQHLEKQSTKQDEIESKKLPVKKEINEFLVGKTVKTVTSSDRKDNGKIKTENEISLSEKQVVAAVVDTTPAKIVVQSEFKDPDVAEKITPAAAIAAVALPDTVTKIISSQLPADSEMAVDNNMPDIKPGKKPLKASWTVLMGAGLHNLTNSGLGLEKSMADYNYGIPQNSSSGGFGNDSAHMIPTQPGAGFMLGIERSQAFGHSKKWSWMAGVHYQYQTMRITTGTRIDSSITLRTNAGSRTKSANYYYRGGNSVEHTGIQHRVQIIAAVQWHLDKKQKWSWQNGFYGGIVLANDYLLPQSSVKVWVPSKGLVNSGYFGLETGMTFQPGRIGAGIFGQYNLTSSVNASNLPKQFWRGVELRINYKLPSFSSKK